MDILKLKEYLNYNEINGDFTWAKQRRAKAQIGSKAGCLTSEGYVAISIDGRRYKAHRLAWLYVYGVWPGGQIDHVNLNKSDNRISNLRLASSSQNSMNVRVRSDSRVGLKGVSLPTGRSKKFGASITIEGKRKWLGRFETALKASEAYQRASRALHGEFARTA